MLPNPYIVIYLLTILSQDTFVDHLQLCPLLDTSLPCITVPLPQLSLAASFVISSCSIISSLQHPELNVGGFGCLKSQTATWFPNITSPGRMLAELYSPNALWHIDPQPTLGPEVGAATPHPSGSPAHAEHVCILGPQLDVGFQECDPASQQNFCFSKDVCNLMAF